MRKRIGKAFLIGGLSGAGMGGGTYALNSGINAINNKAETQSLANELTDVNSYGNAYRLAQISVDNDLAQQYSQAFETVKNNEDIAKAKLENGKLTRGNFAETSEGKQQVKQLNKTAYKVAKQMRKNVSSELKETRAIMQCFTQTNTGFQTSSQQIFSRSTTYGLPSTTTK